MPLSVVQPKRTYRMEFELLFDQAPSTHTPCSLPFYVQEPRWEDGITCKKYTQDTESPSEARHQAVTD